MLWFRVRTALEKSIRFLVHLQVISLLLTMAVLLLLLAVTGMDLPGDSISILDLCKGIQRPDRNEDYVPQPKRGIKRISTQP